MMHLILSFSDDSMADEVIDMVAALLRIMAASQSCKRSFSCESFRDMFIRLLARHTPAETKLKLLGALVILFDDNPVSFDENVSLFGVANFRSAVQCSHLSVSSSKKPSDIFNIIESIATLNKRCSIYVCL
jgi:hypothetical protein